VKDLQTYSRDIKSEALRLGFNACGISAADFLPLENDRLESWLANGYHGDLQYMERNRDKRTDPRNLVEGAKSVVSVILNYYPSENQTDPEAPVIAKYAYGKDYHTVIKNRLQHLLSFICELIPGTEGRVFTDSAPVMEHSWASRSGLGWIGKNSLLINTEFGSFVFIGEVIISAELAYDRPLNDMCGSCRNCINSCPTGAIVEERVIDARKCISYHTIENKTPDMPAELQGKFANRVFGCDICQDVCPWNRKARAHNIAEFEPHPSLLEMSRDEWYSMDKGKFNEVFKDSAVKRAGFEGIRRNMTFIESPAKAGS
jgi:epoxyqueuosine reductase